MRECENIEVKLINLNVMAKKILFSFLLLGVILCSSSLLFAVPTASPNPANIYMFVGEAQTQHIVINTEGYDIQSITIVNSSDPTATACYLQIVNRQPSAFDIFCRAFFATAVSCMIEIALGPVSFPTLFLINLAVNIIIENLTTLTANIEQYFHILAIKTRRLKLLPSMIDTYCPLNVIGVNAV